jgi:hypothetical protein
MPFMSRRPKRERAALPARPPNAVKTPLKSRRPWPRWLRWLLGVSLAAGVVFVAWLNFWPRGQPAGEEAFPLPPYSGSRFLNTTRESQFVGNDACTTCHRDRHESYLLTPHSRALSDLDPATEPADGSFFHKPSGCFYRVYRQDGRLRHEEVLRTAEGKEIARVDLPIRYRVGSGHFARTYLVEVDGFLHESPITWYASKQQWGMSPGYDSARHMSFERPITAGCLVCHTGRVAPGSAFQGVTLHAKAIGCESCHGPGAQHVAARQTGKAAVGEEDLTIVQPGKLPRPLLEDVCAACHLNAAARVYLRGRQVTDFRPGMPLTDYRIDYRFDSGNEQMTVVGHMEQLRQSACYRKSESMSCLTCHDPHARERPADTTAIYRQKCLSCHASKGCKLDAAERLKKNAADNCAACHMPRGDTDIPHVAFTHHRIGLHASKPSAGTLQVPNLVAINDSVHLTPVDKQRNLGLAYMEVARKPEYSSYAGAYVNRARTILEAAHGAGLRDGHVLCALAEIYLQTDPERCKTFAGEVLAAKDIPADIRSNALMLLAACEMKVRNYPSAIGLLKELVPLRRYSEDWGLLGICHQAQQEPREALAALQKALAIRPDNPSLHAKLAEVYASLGDQQSATEHREKAQWLAQQRP